MPGTHVIFELCAESLEACLLAADAGADRIELCSDLSAGGLTPDRALIESAVSRSRLPVHVMLRPRAGDFQYSAQEFAQILEELRIAQDLGAAGVVFGALHADGTVNKEQTRTLVERAAPIEVTFHRAFDETPDLDQALEDVIASGCHRILTSGGAPDVVGGADSLAHVVERAGNRINIAAGGGLRVANARQVAQRTHARHFHGSMLADEAGLPTLAERIRAVVQTLREA